MGNTDLTKRNIQCIAVVSIILLMGIVALDFKTTKQNERKDTNPSTIETLSTINDNEGAAIRLNPAYHKKYDEKSNTAVATLKSIDFSMNRDKVIAKLGKPSRTPAMHYDNPRRYRGVHSLVYTDYAMINGISGRLEFCFLCSDNADYYFSTKLWKASTENFNNGDFQTVVYAILDALEEPISSYQFEKDKYWETYSAEWEDCELTCLVRIGGTEASYTLSFANEEENSMNI